jgi:hypothetical protein
MASHTMQSTWNDLPHQRPKPGGVAARRRSRRAAWETSVLENVVVMVAPEAAGVAAARVVVATITETVKRLVR